MPYSCQRFGELGITPQLCAWSVRCPREAVDARYHEGLHEYLPACSRHMILDPGNAFPA